MERCRTVQATTSFFDSTPGDLLVFFLTAIYRCPNILAMRRFGGGLTMRRARFIPIVSVGASIAVGTLGVQALAADELRVQTKLPTETQLAQTGKPPKAKTKILFEQKLAGIPGFKVQIVLVDGPPGPSRPRESRTWRTW